MFGLFEKDEKTNSKEDAKERLEIVLVHDRINLNPAKKKKMKEELLRVVSSYVDVETEELELDFSRQEKVSLVASVPVKEKNEEKK